MRIFFAAALMLSAGASAAAADDFWMSKVALDAKPQAFREWENEGLRSLDDATGGEVSKGAFTAVLQWPAAYAQRLRVCFFDNPPQEVRDAIRELASEWEQADNSLRFDWGKNGVRDCEKSVDKRIIHIRVTFANPGFYSALGSGSVLFGKLNEHSMNFEGVDKLTRQQIMEEHGGWYKKAIRHEFGHAIGLIHEHQSPKADCENEYDWDKIYKDMAGPPNNWDKAQVDSQLRAEQLPDIFATKFDPTSVMKYWYPAEMYKKGKDSVCYTENDFYEISAQDRETVRFMYPGSAEEATAITQRNKEKMQALISIAEEQGGSKGGGELLERMFPDTDNDPGDP